MTYNGKTTVAEEIFTGGGEMGALMRSRDWSPTSLGSVENWPQSLKTAVRIMLTSRQAMFVWWGEELINLYNDAYKAILGGKHPEALGQPASYVWREIWDQVGPRVESAMLENKGTYDEALLLIMERNGYPEETYYTFSYSPVPNDQGDTGGIICANTDDTQRIIGERQLALLRELAAGTADARTFHEACTRSASCLESDLYDLPFAMIYLVDDNQENVVLAGNCGIERGHAIVPETVNLNGDSLWPFAEVIKTHQISLISNLKETFGNLPTGAWEHPPHQAVAVPIALAGQVRKAGILVVGLNPFRLFDDNYKGFIELVAAQIAASIANAQAYEEEKKRAEALAEIDRAKTVFFSNVSHEFRTPLTLMLSPLEEVLAATDDTPLAHQRQPLAMIQRNGQRLLKLVNTLLDFSRIEAGRIESVYEPTDLAVFTSELASVFRSAIEKAGMQLKVDCPPLPELVCVDREMWEKIVLNLLSNAFKYTFEGEITVSLRVVGSQVELAVQDTGIGIPNEELPHLFERFHRVKGVQGRSIEGSGIGLSLVQELVHLHSGTVKVTSTVGQGSCFTVSIPTGCAHLPQDRINIPRTLTSTASGATSYLEEALRWISDEGNTYQGTENREKSDLSPVTYHRSPSSAHILLVDDNVDMRDYVSRLLRQHYEVETVGDGMAALAAMRQNRPDLILTDVMMPRLDGFGLLRELRDDPNTREIPIILLSARAGEESRIEGLEAGADDYLTKPFSARELLARVEANLKMAQVRQEAARREQELRSEAESARDQVSLILESITDAFVFLDHQWRYTYVNEQATRLLHKTRTGLLGQKIWEIFPERIGTLFYDQLHRAVAEQVAVVFEVFNDHLNLWFEVHAYPSPNGLAVYFQDISDRKQAEIALRESEARFKLALEATGTVYWERDLINDQLLLSGNFSEPATPQAILYQEALTLVHPEDQDKVHQANETAIAQRGNFEIEHRLKEANDEDWRCVLARGTVLTDATAHPTRIIGVSFDITERKQVQAQLLESQRLTQQIAETVPGVLYVYDLLEQRNIYSNRQVTDLLGYTPEQIQAMGAEVVPTVVHPDDLARSVAYIEEFQTALDGQIRGLEYRNRSADGQWRWLYAQSLVFKRNEDGTPSQILGFAIDITERKQAEAALQESQELLKRSNERFEFAAAAVNCLIYDWDIEQNTLERTEGLTRILGYALDEVEPTANSWGQLIHPEDRQRIISEIGPERKIKDNWTNEYRVRHKDGHYVHVLDQAIVVKRDAQGNPSRMVGSTIDITDRKRAQLELEQTLETLQTLIEASPLPIIVIEPDTTIVQLWNQAAEQVFGWSHAEVLGQPIPIVPQEKLEEWHQVKEAISKGETINGLESFCCKRDRSSLSVSISGSPIYGTQGNVDSLILILQDITERQQTEQALRQSLAILNTINEATPTLIYVKDQQGRLLMSNPAVFRAIGKPESEVLGHTELEFLDNREDAEVIRETDRQIMETGQMQLIEETVQLPEGTRTFLSAKSPYLDEQGEIIGLIGVSFDITDRKQAEEAIRESEQKLRLALQTGKLGSWQLDLITGTLECSHQCKANFGLTPEEDLSYQRLFELIHPDDRPYVQQAIEQAIETHTDYEAEYRTIWPDGSENWILARGRAIYSIVGQPLRMVGVTLDFSDRKQIEQALRESEERLRLTLEASQLGLWYWELKTDTLTWTDQCKALFGLPADAEISYPVFLEALHPDDRKRTHESVTRCIYNRELYDIEYRTQWSDGTVRWIAAKGNCTYDTEEQLIRMMGVAIDITESKQAEQALQERAKELAELNTALTLASSVLQERNQELDQFVYIVSHDLKAPLRAISNLSQWIEDDLAEQLPEENQQQMQLLRERVSRMERLIDGLLDYSRINRHEAAKETVDVGELLEEIIDSLAPPEGFDIITQPLPILNTQRLPLSQVFANLLSNALKHHGGSTGQVDISVKDLGNYYHFSVADNGQGIAPEHHERAFAIFQTLGRSENKMNTGIGLAIVKKIVERQGGKITLESQVGQGTTFHFTWPKSENQK